METEIKRTSLSWFSLLVFLLIVLRLGNILTAVESVSWHEELYEGVLARELIDGLKTSYWNYQASPYGVGSLFIGVLAVPFFLLFGPNLFALKLVPLIFFSLPTLFLLFFFLKRHFGEKAAIWGAFLFVFAPPAFTANSLIALGAHATSVLFSVVILFFFYEFLYGAKHRTFFLLLFGIVSGFAFYFIYTTFLTFLACFASWFFLDRVTFLSRKLLLFFAVMVLGASLFIGYEMSHSMEGSRFLLFVFLPPHRLMTPFPELFLKGVGKVSKFLTIGIPFSFCPRFGWVGQLLGFSYYGIFLTTLFRLPFEKDRRDRTLLPLFLYPIFFVIVHTISTLGVSYAHRFFGARYIIPLQFFLLLLVAISLSVQKSHLLKAAVIVLGFISQGTLLFREDFGRAFHYKGYSYFYLGLYPHQPFDLPIDPPIRIRKILEILERYPKAVRPHLFLGFSTTDSLRDQNKENIAAIFKTLQDLPSPYRQYYLESLMHLFGWKKPLARQWLNSLLVTCSEEEKASIYHGLAWYNKTQREQSLIESHLTPPKFFSPWLSVYERNKPEGPQEFLTGRKNRIYREWGEVFGIKWIWNWCSFAEAISSVPKYLLQIRSEDPENFYWGIGWGLRTVLTDDRLRAADWIKQLPPEGRSPALEGSKAYDKWYWLTPQSQPKFHI